MNKRVEYYDFLRGVSIVGVIGIHAFWVYQDYLKEAGMRSEERRVGKECRSRWSPYH